MVHVMGCMPEENMVGLPVTTVHAASSIHAWSCHHLQGQLCSPGLARCPTFKALHVGFAAVASYSGQHLPSGDVQHQPTILAESCCQKLIWGL